MGDEATKGFVGPHLVHFLLSPAASEPPPEVAEEDPGLPRRARPPRPARLARARLARASFSTQAAWLIGLRPFSTQSATLGPAEVEVRRAALRCAPLRSAALRSRPVRPARSASGSAARACARPSSLLFNTHACGYASGYACEECAVQPGVWRGREQRAVGSGQWRRLPRMPSRMPSPVAK